jgi:hypothetical protein
MIDKENKISILNSMILNCETHINILLDDILNNPDGDVEGKPTRQSVLDEFNNKKNSLQEELSFVENN